MTSIDHDAKSRDKLLNLAAICLSALVLPLSFTGGAVATPAIGRDLGGSPVALTWITNAFMLPVRRRWPVVRPHWRKSSKGMPVPGRSVCWGRLLVSAWRLARWWRVY